MEKTIDQIYTTEMAKRSEIDIFSVRSAIESFLDGKGQTVEQFASTANSMDVYKLASELEIDYAAASNALILHIMSSEDIANLGYKAQEGKQG